MTDKGGAPNETPSTLNAGSCLYSSECRLWVESRPKAANVCNGWEADIRGDLLNFFVGVPIVLALIGAAVIVKKLDRRTDQ